MAVWEASIRQILHRQQEGGKIRHPCTIDTVAVGEINDAPIDNDTPTHAQSNFWQLNLLRITPKPQNS